MITDWKKEIAVAWYVQNETSKLDTAKQWNYFLPNVAATEEEVVRVEEALGHPVDARYRGFLKFANGWRGFYQRVDLFGTAELANGAPMHLAMSLLRAIEPEALEKSGVQEEQLLPIAVSSSDLDLFVITRPPSPQPGVVIWFAGYEIQRFTSFDEFFLAMVDYNRLRCERFRIGQEGVLASRSIPKNTKRPES